MRKLANAELERLSKDQLLESQRTPLVIVLDNVRSLNNIGSIFRSSDAYLIEEVILCGITAQPPHREIQKTALGATETVPWTYYKETSEAIANLKTRDFKTYAIEQVDQSIALNKFTPSKGDKLAVILGNEVDGVDSALLPIIDGCIELPQFGHKHSLNISVCGGIVVWDLYWKLQQANN